MQSVRNVTGLLFALVIGLFLPFFMVGLTMSGNLQVVFLSMGIPLMIGLLAGPLFSLSLDSIIILLVAPLILFGTYAISSALSNLELLITNILYWYGSALGISVLVFLGDKLRTITIRFFSRERAGPSQ